MFRQSRTARQLLRLRRGLLATTIALIVTSFAVWGGVQATATTVRDRTAPAILAVSSAKTALVGANAAAVHSFDNGEVLLAGPGEDYQNQTALASQNLARAAELNEAGDSASEFLQVVEALLTEYTGAIGQADAHYRQPDGRLLGVADLWNSSRLLHSGDDGVLVRLDDLLTTQQAALGDELSSGWTHPLAPALWLTPAVVLLALLVWTQWTLRKRFRRRFNPPLLAATALLIAVIAGMSWTFAVQRDLREAGNFVEQVVHGRDLQARTNDTEQQRELEAMLGFYCDQSGGCGPTVASTAPHAPPAAAPDGVTGDITRANQSLAAATGAGWLRFANPLAGVVLGALLLWGLQPRLDEYRHQS